MALRKPKQKEEMEEDPARIEQKREIIGILLVFLALLGFWAIVGRSDGQGYVGEYLRAFCTYIAGRNLSGLPLIFLGVIGINLIVRRTKPTTTRSWLGLVLLFLVILTGFDLIARHQEFPVLEVPQAGGGLIGGLLALGALRAFGRVGAWFLLAAVSVISLLLITGRRLVELCGLNALRRRRSEERPKPIPAPAEDRKETAAGHSEREQPPVREEEAPPRNRPESSPLYGGGHRKFTLPATDLLQPPRLAKLTRANPDQRRQLEETLASFGVQAKVVDVHRGPVITRYDLQPAAGVKVSRIVSLADDLALALAARGLRIEAPIPGKAALGIEVPNKESRAVGLREVIESNEFASGGLLGFALGRDIGGDAVVGDLTRMPHLLIAGATGSGKSVCLNTIIMSFLFRAGPDRIKMIMIDPKMVELTAYNGIPHLISPVVTEAKRAPAALKWAVGEMENRYKQLMQAGCRDIETYNRAQTDPDTILPYIVIVVDELADLMMIARVDVEDAICRLAQMARATGIHLLLATQRPSVDVITGLIKANIPSRIAFAVSSITDSRTILDSGGAERLLGRGDMLYSPVGVLKPRRIQGALVEEDEVRAVVAFWRAQNQDTPAMPEFTVQAGGDERDPAAEDDLFWEAVKVVVDFKQASASVLQRRLRIGYSRAARLVDLMEAKGFVGPFEGSKPREVRITAEQLAAMRERE